MKTPILHKQKTFIRPDHCGILGADADICRLMSCIWYRLGNIKFWYINRYYLYMFSDRVDQTLVTKICDGGRMSDIWQNFLPNIRALNRKHLTYYLWNDRTVILCVLPWPPDGHGGARARSTPLAALIIIIIISVAKQRAFWGPEHSPLLTKLCTKISPGEKFDILLFSQLGGAQRLHSAP